MIGAYIASIVVVTAFCAFALVLVHRLKLQVSGAHQAEIEHWRERHRKLIAHCRELENELTAVKLGAGVAGYQFEDVPARVIPARTRLAKVRT